MIPACSAPYLLPAELRDSCLLKEENLFWKELNMKDSMGVGLHISKPQEIHFQHVYVSTEASEYHPVQVVCRVNVIGPEE